MGNEIHILPELKFLFENTNKHEFTPLTSKNERVLNYYEFNILLDQTKLQNTIFHRLDDYFFDELALHKNKIFFRGTYEKEHYNIHGFMYNVPPKKMSIHARKHIGKTFEKLGFTVVSYTLENEVKKQIASFLFK